MAKSIAWILAITFLIWLFSNIQGTILTLIFGWLLAYFLRPLVCKIEGTVIPYLGWRMGRVPAVLTSYFIVIVGIIAFGFFALPSIAEQLSEIQKVFPFEKIENLGNNQLDYGSLVQAGVERLESFLPQGVLDSIRPSLEDLGRSLLAYMADLSGSIFRLLGSTISQLFSAAVFFGSALLVSYYVLVEWEELRDSFLNAVPDRLVDDVQDLWSKMDQVFGGYIKATFSASVMCFFATMLTCGFISLVFDGEFPYIVLLSFFAAISYPIPILGILATSVLAGFLSLIPEGNTVTFALIMMVGVNIANTIIDRFVLPALMSDSIGVSELFVLLAAFAGAETMGAMGMLIGVPVAAMGKTVWDWFYERFLVRGDFVFWNEDSEIEEQERCADEQGANLA